MPGLALNDSRDPEHMSSAGCTLANRSLRRLGCFGMLFMDIKHRGSKTAVIEVAEKLRQRFCCRITIITVFFKCCQVRWLAFVNSFSSAFQTNYHWIFILITGSFNPFMLKIISCIFNKFLMLFLENVRKCVLSQNYIFAN